MKLDEHSFGNFWADFPSNSAVTDPGGKEVRDEEVEESFLMCH